MKKDNISLFTKLYSIAIILLPFLCQYASPLPFLSLGDFLIALFTIYGLFKIDVYRAGRYIKPILAFSSAFIFLTIFVSFFSLAYFKYSDASTIFLKILLYSCVCLVCTQCFDLCYVKKFYIYLVRIFAVYLIVQVIYHKMSGEFLPNYFNYNWLFYWEKRFENLHDYYSVFYHYFRPSSLFIEPAYYVLYVLPALFLLLFEQNKFIEPIFLYFTIILSTSGSGIIIGLLAFALKGLTLIAYRKNGKIYLTGYSLVAMIMFLALILFLLLEKGEILSKLFNSFNARITRSLMIFREMDAFHRIFGIGMNNTANYVSYYKIYTFYDEDNLNFGASLVASLVQYGIIGFVIFFGSLIALVINARNSKIGLLLILLYIIYTAFEEVVFNYRMAFLLSFVIYFIRVSNQKAYVRTDENVIIKLSKVKQ